MSLPLSGSQTVGPYFAIGLSTLCSRTIVHGAEAQTLVVEGHVFDGDGVAIPDAFLEVWQANRYGRYDAGRASDSAGVADGFGRIGTDSAGRFRFATIKPGPVPYDADRMQASHLLVLVAGSAGARSIRSPTAITP